MWNAINCDSWCRDGGRGKIIIIFPIVKHLIDSWNGLMLWTAASVQLAMFKSHHLLLVNDQEKEEISKHNKIIALNREMICTHMPWRQGKFLWAIREREWEGKLISKTQNIRARVSIRMCWLISSIDREFIKKKLLKFNDLFFDVFTKNSSNFKHNCWRKNQISWNDLKLEKKVKIWSKNLIFLTFFQFSMSNSIQQMWIKKKVKQDDEIEIFLAIKTN